MAARGPGYYRNRLLIRIGKTIAVSVPAGKIDRYGATEPLPHVRRVHRARAIDANGLWQVQFQAGLIFAF
jgi:hypothetical protein